MKHKIRITILTFISFSLVIGLCGCASWIVRPQKVILLPEERIFTLNKGTPVKLSLDKKPIDITFPEDMKVVSTEVLVRQEAKLNDAVLGKDKAERGKKGAMAVFGSILALITAVLGAFKKSWLPKKVTLEAK